MRIAKARPFEGKPIINMPSVYGGCIGKEIICRVPVIGTRPIRGGRAYRRPWGCPRGCGWMGR